MTKPKQEQPDATLDDFLDMRSLSDLDLQAITETLHAGVRVLKRERAAQALAKLCLVFISEARSRGLLEDSQKHSPSEMFPDVVH